MTWPILYNDLTVRQQALVRHLFQSCRTNYPTPCAWYNNEPTNRRICEQHTGTF